MNLFKKFSKNEKGATAIEYALIAALLGVVLIAGLSSVAGGLNELFTAVGDEARSAASDLRSGPPTPPSN